MTPHPSMPKHPPTLCCWKADRHPRLWRVLEDSERSPSDSPRSEREPSPFPGPALRSSEVHRFQAAHRGCLLPRLLKRSSPKNV